MREYETVEVTHVPREQNTVADILSKLASTQTASGNKTIIQEVLNEPNVQRHKTQPLEVNTIIGIEDWRRPITRYITSEELPSYPLKKNEAETKGLLIHSSGGNPIQKGFHHTTYQVFGT